MKIAVVGSKGLPPSQGGIEYHCAEIYPRMVAQGHTVDLFARSLYTGASLNQAHFKGVRVIPLPSPLSGGLDAMMNSALGAILAIGMQYDIIHFHALGPALFSLLPRIISSAKVVVTCHGLDWQRAKWGKLAIRSILLGEKVAVSCAHEMIVVSEALHSYFLQTYGRDFLYIPNAPTAYAASDHNFAWGAALGLEQKRYVVFLGRLVPEKRPDLLIQAFQALQPPGWKLVLVGSPDSSSFNAQLRSLATDPGVLFTGELKGNRLAEIVRGSGLCVFPSDLEGLPMAVLEAMEEGIPIVASDIPPHRQLLGSDRGVLFQKGDLDSCIQKLDWAIHHPHRLKTMAQRAQAYVRSNYNWDRIAAASLELYEAILDKPQELATNEQISLHYNKSW